MPLQLTKIFKGLFTIDFLYITGERMIAIRCEPSIGIQVFIAQSPRKDFFASELVQDTKWENLGGAFKEIKLDKMEGKNFLNKMELLMACLSSPS